MSTPGDTSTPASLPCVKCSQRSLRAHHPQSDDGKQGLHWLCGGCGGLWISSVAALHMARRGHDPQPALIDSNESYRRRDACTGHCPAGHGQLLRLTVHAQPPFALERCIQCGGLWFDNGEWSQLLASPQRGALLGDWSRADALLDLAAMRERIERGFIAGLIGELVLARVESLADDLRGIDGLDHVLAYLRRQTRRLP